MASNRAQQGSVSSSSHGKEVSPSDKSPVMFPACQPSDIADYFIARMSVMDEIAHETDTDAMLQELEAEMAKGPHQAAAIVAQGENALHSTPSTSVTMGIEIQGKQK